MLPSSSYLHPAILGFALLPACTNGPDVVDEPSSGASASLESSAEFTELLAADWELAPGTERYVCTRKTLADTVFVSAWHSDAPLGTHHILVTTSAQPDGEPDGQSECDTVTLGTQNVHAGGVGSPDRRMPRGVAFKLAQGAQALLNVHIFNTTDQVLRGRSGVAIQSLAHQDVREVADLVLATSVSLAIPPGRSTSHARCTFDRDATVFGVGPHMHQMGVAMQVVAHTAIQGAVVLYDGPYSFDDQRGYGLEPLLFKAGDTVDVACTYENTTNRTLHFGGSSTDEMCEAGLGRYPAGGPSLCAR